MKNVSTMTIHMQTPPPKIKVAAITNDMAVSIQRMDYGCQLRHVFGQQGINKTQRWSINDSETCAELKSFQMHEAMDYPVRKSVSAQKDA